MWPAPIGWWCRVSPAIYTARAQDLGSVVVDSSLACLAFGQVGEHTLLYWQYGTLQAAAPWEGPPVERARPHYIPSRVLPWSQPNLARRSGAPGDVQYLCTVYREYEINALVELEQKLCSCCSWAGTSSTLVSWRALGRCPSFHGGPLGDLVEVKTYTTRRLLSSIALGNRSKRRSQSRHSFALCLLVCTIARCYLTMT